MRGNINDKKSLRYNGKEVVKFYHGGGNCCNKKITKNSNCQIKHHLGMGGVLFYSETFLLNFN